MAAGRPLRWPLSLTTTSKIIANSRKPTSRAVIGQPPLAARSPRPRTAPNSHRPSPAPLWAQATKAELGRVGLRPAAPVGVSGITAAEARVAELVAAGRTNREVAGELFMSLKTVEAHLSRIYRKLGVRSRAELAHRLT